MRILPKGKMQLMEHDALGVVGPAILFCQTTAAIWLSVYFVLRLLSKCMLSQMILGYAE